MLSIDQEVLEAMISHARQELPWEACGYLAGRNGRICHAFPLSNLDRSREHFTMDPAEQFAAVKAMRVQGLSLAGVYHSHPDTPARPSAEDIRLAHDPNLAYLIVSLAGDRPLVKAFSIHKGVVSEREIRTARTPTEQGESP